MLAALRIHEQVVQFNGNIGAEGLITIFSASMVQEPEQKCLLAIFIGTYEEVEFRVSTPYPKTLEELEDAKHTLMEMLCKYYKEYSIAERNTHARVN